MCAYEYVRMRKPNKSKTKSKTKTSKRINNRKKNKSKETNKQKAITNNSKIRENKQQNQQKRTSQQAQEQQNSKQKQKHNEKRHFFASQRREKNNNNAGKISSPTYHTRQPKTHPQQEYTTEKHTCALSCCTGKLPNKLAKFSNGFLGNNQSHHVYYFNPKFNSFLLDTIF